MTREALQRTVTSAVSRDPVWRKATRHDLSGALGLFDEVTHWLVARGIDQWGSSAWRDDELMPAIDAGSLFLAEVGGVVGAVVVDDVADPEFWMPADRPEDALYLHHLAVSRRLAGHGLGAWLIDRAAELTRAAGRSFLRLDADRSNPRLHRYYSSVGFTHVRTIERPGRRSGALFQRRVDRDQVSRAT